MPAWTITPSPRSCIGSSVHAALRGRLETLLARREIGGLLCEFAKHHPKDRRSVRGISRSPLSACRTTKGRPHSVMGQMAALRSHLAAVAGRGAHAWASRSWSLGCEGSWHWQVCWHAAVISPWSVAPPRNAHLPAGLPNDCRGTARASSDALLSKQRVLRARIVVLEGQAAYAADRVSHLRRDAAHLRRRIRQMPNPPPSSGLTAGTSRREVAGVFAPRSTQCHTIR